MKKMLYGISMLWLAGCTTVSKDCPMPPCNLEAAPLATLGKAGVPSAALSGSLSTLPSVVYFDFDISEVRPDQRQVIETNAAYLTKHPQFKVRLEGHADERGSREYNLALGERRAQSVKRYLMMLGVQENQLDTLSYGEEKPAVDGHDDHAWKFNRRVEFIYIGQGR